MAQWTNVKEARLMVLAERGMTAKAIGIEIDMTRGAVAGKAARLGIKLMGRKAEFDWTPERLALLKAMADGTMHLKDMAAVFDHQVTEHAIGVKLRRMGISLDQVRERYSRERQHSFRAILEQRVA